MVKLALKPVHRSLVAGLVALGLVLPAMAQPPAPVNANDTLVDDLVVTAVRPGPAYWRAQRKDSPDSVVWIMGATTALPKGVTWNQAETKRHLKGANQLILGPDQQVGNVFSLIWIFLTQREKFMAEAPLDKTLPPDLYARYEKASVGNRMRRGDDASTRNVKPILAALGVAFGFQRGLDMEQREPERTVRRMAIFQVKSKRAGETVALDFVKLLQTMPRAVELACMDDALSQIEAGRERQIEAARGWARGDLRVAVSAQRGWERCITQDKEIAAINERNIQAAVDAIAGALDKPGKAVALVELRPLLAQNGVIVRLRARGIEITPPDVPGIEEAEEGRPASSPPQ